MVIFSWSRGRPGYPASLIPLTQMAGQLKREGEITRPLGLVEGQIVLQLIAAAIGLKIEIATMALAGVALSGHIQADQQRQGAEGVPVVPIQTGHLPVKADQAVAGKWQLLAEIAFGQLALGAQLLPTVTKGLLKAQ